MVLDRNLKKLEPPGNKLSEYVFKKFYTFSCCVEHVHTDVKTATVRGKHVRKIDRKSGNMPEKIQERF
jgi:hypothetical protein